MTAGVLSLVEFLLARIAEDEASHPYVLKDRKRAECEAKRRIVEHAWAEVGPTAAEEWLFPVLASVYADHPDYRAEWKP